MLLSILDLEKATVEDIMVPRNEIVGIDITEPREAIRDAIVGSQHTRLPVFDGSIDNLKRSEEHTSELQSLMRISYAVFCLKKKQKQHNNTTQSTSIKHTRHS